MPTNVTICCAWQNHRRPECTPQSRTTGLLSGNISPIKCGERTEGGFNAEGRQLLLIQEVARLRALQAELRAWPASAFPANTTIPLVDPAVLGDEMEPVGKRNPHARYLFFKSLVNVRTIVSANRLTAVAADFEFVKTLKLNGPFTKCKLAHFCFVSEQMVAKIFPERSSTNACSTWTKSDTGWFNEQSDNIIILPDASQSLYSLQQLARHAGH